MFVISIGELIDRLSIVNIKQWHFDEAIAKAKEKKDFDKAGRLAMITKDLNKERADLREEINLRLEGKTTSGAESEHADIGR